MYTTKRKISHESRPASPYTTTRTTTNSNSNKDNKIGDELLPLHGDPCLRSAGGAGVAAATGDADGHLQKAGKKLLNPINTPAAGVKPDPGTRAVNPKKVSNTAFSALPLFAHCSSPTGANGQGFPAAAASAGWRGAGESTKKGKNDIFHAPVRYVRPTPKERRERIYAYYAAKKLIREAEANSTPSPSEFPTPFSSHEANTRVAAPDGTPSASDTGARDYINEHVEPQKDGENEVSEPLRKENLPHSDSVNAEERLLEQLRYLVDRYEKLYNRETFDCSKRVFPVPALSQLVHTEDSEEQQQQQGQQQGKEGRPDSPTEEYAFRSKESSMAPGCDDWGRRFELTLSAPHWQGLSGLDESFPLYETDPSIIHQSNGEHVGDALRDTLAFEQERRTQGVRRHLMKALLSFDLVSQQSRRGRDDGRTSTCRTAGFQNYPFEDLTGVCETLLDTPVDAAPHSHVRQLLKWLAEEPTVQKCAEATGRLVTYVLMRSLPVELYEGDPEDYRTLRQRSRKAEAMSCSKTREACSVGDWRKRDSPTQLTQTAPQLTELRHVTEVKSDNNKTLTAFNEETKVDNRYFLHQDSMSLTQALQSVALQKGIWLSSTVPMMQRPPLHACGLPLRVARGIALWQRPPSGSKDSTLQGSQGLMNGNANTVETFKSGKNSRVNSPEEADDWRPKTLAPLLIIAFGGYGVAPFSTCGSPLSTPKGMTGEVDFSFASEQQHASDGANNTILSAMNNFMHPEPALLPLQSVMRVIYGSVRLNRLISMDEIADVFPPVILELLMDVVKSFRDIFQSILNMSFEPASSRSFFLHTYRETLLSWATIVVCEAAMGHAAERAGLGPLKVPWTSGVMPGKFTEEQLEKIAFSGLVERTLPSMTQWEYDEQLFIHTIDTLRSVVIETIGRVKGELYFFMTGVDSRKAVLEQHRERLRRFRAREQAIIAEAEERLQASLPGGNVGVTRPTSAVQSMSQGEGDRPQSPSRIHSPYRAGRSSSRSCSRHEQSRHFPFRRRPDNCKRSFFSNAGNDSCQRTGEFSSRLPSNLMPRQPGSKLHAGKRHMHEDGAVAENTFSSLQSTLKHSPEWGDNTALESQFIDGSAGPPLSLRKELVPLKSFSLSSTISALFKKSTASCKASQGQRQPSPGSFLFRTVSSGTQSIRSMGRQNVSELAEKLTVRNVRRELVSLKIRTRQSTVVARESVEGEALCSQLSPQTKMASTQATGNCGLSDTCKYGLVSAAGGFGMTVTTPSSFFRSSLTAPNPLDGTRSKPTSDETTLASVVGAKQAASVARIRRTCENTAQFYLHFNNMINADGSGRCTGAESQWYATGSMGFYERRAVATIKRSRQVAGFDLHHLSPITALERCVQWPSSRGAPSHTGRQEEGEEEEQREEKGGGGGGGGQPSPSAQTLRAKACQKKGWWTLKPKELHLGEKMVPWTL
ncbi:hypothetical protein C3747_15g166 [Trypanosoma cruzi]|uniref:Uncharacterized protein n=1 Tax=Trypanosoma cruzi TaxID=5693 RepID=A0A2V2XAZ5_TRYCR|nr:hypothetical protein C3747_15g166 [Trypanosoma cruzi]